MLLGYLSGSHDYSEACFLALNKPQQTQGAGETHVFAASATVDYSHAYPGMGLQFRRVQPLGTT
jgi:hypothetical protein